MRPGDPIEVVIEKGVFRGRGLARHAGRVVLVRNGYPGERWRVRVREVAHDFALAEGEELLEGVGARRRSPCPYFPQCGGCAHQDLTYEAQLRLKREVIADALSRARLDWTGEIEVAPSPEEGWRTRASLHVHRERDQGATHLGFTAEASHRVIDVARCLHLGQGATRLLGELREALNRRPALAARVRRIELAESGDGERRAVALAGELRPGDSALAKELLAEAPSLSGIGLLIGGSGGRVGRFAGAAHVESRVLGVELRSHVLSFFQGNRFLVERLVQEVGQRVGQGGTLIDVYGGVGLFALGLASRFERVVCIEGDGFAVNDAEANARRLGASHVRIVRGDVARALAGLPPAAGERIVLDPPRSGAGAAVMRAVTQRAPAVVVFVSCDPPTLARDLRLLVSSGYRISAVSALDMFPGTFHVETVVGLERVR